MASLADKVWTAFFVIAVLLVAGIDSFALEGAFFEFVTQWKGAIIIALSIGAIGHVFSSWQVPDN